MRREFTWLSNCEFKASYTIGEDENALVLFVNMDSRHSFDVYLLQGTARQLLYLRIPKVRTELEPGIRRELAK
jgi:hypothetical protein